MTIERWAEQGYLALEMHNCSKKHGTKSMPHPELRHAGLLYMASAVPPAVRPSQTVVCLADFARLFSLSLLQLAG